MIRKVRKIHRVTFDLTSICGVHGDSKCMTNKNKLVTCKRCLKIIEKAQQGNQFEL